MEFVRFVVTEVNRAYRTPSAAILDPYITTTCPGCQDIRRHVAEMEQLHQRTNGDTWFVTSALPNTWVPGSATVVLRIQQKRVDFIDDQGRKVDYMVDGTYEYVLTLTRDPAWRVSRWQKI